MPSQYTISSAHVQLVQRVSCPCPVSRPSLLPMILTSQSHSTTINIQSVHHLLPSSSQNTTSLSPCPIRLPSLLPLSNQNTIFSGHVQSVIISCSQIHSVYHLSYACPVSRPSLLPMYYHNTTYSAHYQSKSHLYCPRPVITSSLLPSSSQNTTPLPMPNQ